MSLTITNVQVDAQCTLPEKSTVVEGGLDHADELFLERILTRIDSACGDARKLVQHNLDAVAFTPILTPVTTLNRGRGLYNLPNATLVVAGKGLDEGGELGAPDSVLSDSSFPSTAPSPSMLSTSTRASSWASDATVVEESRFCVDDFIIGQNLGSGSFGSVHLVKHKGTRRLMALKVVKKYSDGYETRIEDMSAELAVLKNVSGQHHLLDLFAASHDRTNFYFVSEYYPGGDLDSYMTQLGVSMPIKQIRFYASEIVSALKHLHQRGIIHRDLKPSNVMLTGRGHLVLVDFGLAKDFQLEKGKRLPLDGLKSFHVEDQYQADEICGTPYYIAPEIWQGIGGSFGIDFYALGVMLYEFVFLDIPFEHDDDVELSKMVRNNEPSYILPSAKILDDSDCEGLLTLMKGLLAKDPVQRFGAVLCMKSPFFAETNWLAVSEHRVEPPFIPGPTEFLRSALNKAAVRPSLPYSRSDDPFPEFNFLSTQFIETLTIPDVKPTKFPLPVSPELSWAPNVGNRGIAVEPIKRRHLLKSRSLTKSKTSKRIVLLPTFRAGISKAAKFFKATPREDDTHRSHPSKNLAQFLLAPFVDAGGAEQNVLGKKFILRIRGPGGWRRKAEAV